MNRWRGSRFSCCGSSARTCWCSPRSRCWRASPPPAGLVAAVAGTYAFIAIIDAIRINVDVPAGLGYLNLVAWLIPGMLGVAYRRHLLAGRAALLLGVAMFAVNLLLMWSGPYELSLVGIETQQLKNMTPPSLLLAGHAIMMCAFAIAAAPAIARWARRPRVWWLTAIGNSGAMTLYLWHIPLLLGMHLVFDYLGYPRYDAGGAGFVALSILQLSIMAGLVAAAFVALRPLESNPLPLWDGGRVTAPGARSTAVGTLLCVAGAATLASVGWGLQGPGPLLRRGDAGGVGRGEVPCHRPAGRRSARLRSQPAREHQVGRAEAAAHPRHDARPGEHLVADRGGEHPVDGEHHEASPP